jgi:hypothetical protein
MAEELRFGDDKVTSGVSSVSSQQVNKVMADANYVSGPRKRN